MDQNSTQKSDAKADTTATPAASHQTQNSQKSPEESAAKRAAADQQRGQMTERTLAAKIAAISKDLGAIKKGGHNKEQHYDFIEYAAVSGKIRELLDKHGVAIIPTVTDYERDDVKSKNGATGYHYTLKMHFTVINADKMDEKIEADWMGESTDWGDKGINKAETSGTKYFYMRLFNISEKGDADNDPDSQDNNAAESTPTKREYKQDPRLNFDTIRETCAGIDDGDSLTDYYREVMELEPSAKSKPYIVKIFQKRRAEIGEHK